MNTEKKEYVTDYIASEGFIGKVKNQVRFNQFTGKEQMVDKIYVNAKALNAYLKDNDHEMIAIEMFVSKSGEKYAKMSTF